MRPAQWEKRKRKCEWHSFQSFTICCVAVSNKNGISVIIPVVLVNYSIAENPAGRLFHKDKQMPWKCQIYDI